MKVVLASVIVLAHSWYPWACCHDQHCHPVPCESIKENALGLSWNGIVFTEPMIRESLDAELARLLLKPDRERALAREQVKALDIRPPNVEARLRGLSGGNQQKVGLAKWLTHAPRILLLAEPTRGMDVGAKEDVVKIVRALREKGIAIVVFSTEPETVLSLADRVLVMRKGEIAHEFADEAISKDRLLAAA